MRLLLTQRGAPTEGVILDIAHTLSTCGSWGLRSWVDMMCSGRPLSRVLFEAKRFATVIHLACLLPNTSSDIPEGLEAGHLSGLGRHPLFVLLRVGFTMRASSPKRRCALTAPFHRDRYSEEPNGRLLSVALSRGSPLVAVSDHPALRSPDFPPILWTGDRAADLNGLKIRRSVGLRKQKTPDYVRFRLFVVCNLSRLAWSRGYLTSTSIPPMRPSIPPPALSRRSERSIFSSSTVLSIPSSAISLSAL